MSATQFEQARCLCAIVLRHPALLRDIEEAFAGLALPPSLAAIRDAVLDWADAELESDLLLTHLRASGLAAEALQVMSADPVPLPACASADAMPAEAEAGWWHYFGLMHQDSLQDDLGAASREFIARPNEATQRRLLGLRSAQLALTEFGPEADADA